MSEPLVCAIMLVNGREAMVSRAVASFRAQSYDPARRMLIVLDTGATRVTCGPSDCENEGWDWWPQHAGRTIGALRNFANAHTSPLEDETIICHWDSDDWSHPQRIAEQVALLPASGADAVGYYEAPFWDTRICHSCAFGSPYVPYEEPGTWHGTSRGPHRCDSSAWLYRELTRRVPLGASLCYWRKTWERRPFDDINHGEDERFSKRCTTAAVSAMKLGALEVDPRIVCGAHGSNTSTAYDFSKRQACFTRAAQFDDYCRKVMQL